jgi:hypothetical protein
VKERKPIPYDDVLSKLLSAKPPKKDKEPKPSKPEPPK